MAGEYMKVILSLLIGSNCFAANYIDLGNLEIEGELRRPAINLFINTEMVKDNLKEYARIKVENLLLLEKAKMSELDEKNATIPKINDHMSPTVTPSLTPSLSPSTLLISGRNMLSGTIGGGVG